MKYRNILFAVALAAGLTGTAAVAGPRDDPPRHSQQQQRDSQRAFEATREGRSMPLPQLERRVLPIISVLN